MIVDSIPRSKMQQTDGQLVPIELSTLPVVTNHRDDEAFEEGRQRLSLALLVCDPILGNLTLLPPLQPYLLQNAIGRSTRPNRTRPNYTRHQKEGRQRLSLSLVRDPIPPVLSSFLPGARAAEQLGG